MFAKLVVILLIFSQIHGNDLEAETPLSGTQKGLELDNMFRGLILSNQIGDTTNYTHKETIGGQGYVDDCLSSDPISIDISFNHIKMHLFYDNFTQSRTIRYQIRCYLKSLVFAKRISIREIRLGPLMHNDSIIDDGDCEKLKRVIGKSSKNEMYFIITGTPKKCDNFIGLGIFVMLNPMQNGRPYPFKNNNQFREFKKDMI
uniref:Astacin domain-containing protein n=1 Tax=Strongyloides papillosus TaxID=174720 RepID=A0A0N5CB69_STREA